MHSGLCNFYKIVAYGTRRRLIKTIFKEDSGDLERFVLLAAMSVALMLADARLAQMTLVRSGLVLAATPLQWVVQLPARTARWISDVSTSREFLESENARLTARNMVLEGKSQRLISMEAENIRLRMLLNASDSLDESVMVAEVISVDPDPFTHKIFIDKGSRHGVFKGQPVLGATGLMGQVVQVDPYSSRVLLITDSNHAIPVQVARNGLRAIAIGTSSIMNLELVHVPDTADIRVGDTLISSGMGRRFPSGYPVAVVVDINHHPGRPFAKVRATPTAELDRGRYVLLVFTEQSRTPAQAGAPAAGATETPAEATLPDTGAQ